MVAPTLRRSSLEGKRDRRTIAAPDDFRSWPLTSCKALQKHGRYRINSGQTAPSGLTSSAAFDPTETSAVRRYILANASGRESARMEVSPGLRAISSWQEASRGALLVAADRRQIRRPMLWHSNERRVRARGHRISPPMARLHHRAVSWKMRPRCRERTPARRGSRSGAIVNDHGQRGRRHTAWRNRLGRPLHIAI